MPSTISAGTTAGTAIAIAGDTTGNLAFQTNGTTTAMTIDTSQNVGIGTTSPTARMTVFGTGIGSAIDFTNTTASTGRSYRWVSRNDGNFSVEDMTAVGSPQRIAVAPNGDFAFNSGYGSASTAYGCRAWVNFNGTGTIAIRGSGNISSITDNGAGAYRLNFANNLPDGNFSVTGTAQRVGNPFSINPFSPSASQVFFETMEYNQILADSTFVSIAIFR